MATRNEEQRVEEIIVGVLRRREAGEDLKDEDVVAANPELADQLKETLRQLQIVANARRLAAVNDIEETVSHAENSVTVAGAGNRKLFPGQQIRHYVLEEQIGLGGFGSVWRARDRKLVCEVAMKIPARESLTHNDIQRFIREARVSAQLRQHPNIVSVHEADWDDQTAFIVCDLIDGESLGDRIDKSRVSPGEAVKLMIQICSALQHAHNAGVIHRDLKPDNILLDADGNPHITDFGLAKRESQIAATESGEIMGTAAYMSPEQARGESDRADCRSDLFSLGVVFFEMLTGERPFRGSVPLVLQQIVANDPLRPRSFDPRIPVDLETICLKCLEKDPARRYESANELSEDLQRYQRHEPIRAHPVSAAGRLLRWSKRNPSIPLLSLSLIVVTIIATWASFHLIQTEVGEMQTGLKGRAEESLELLSLYAAHEANLNLYLRFNQVGSMKSDLGPEVIRQLAEWNYSTDERDREKALGKLISSEGENPPDKLLGIQEALADLKKRTRDPDIRDRTYSVFVCDAQGNQIARSPTKDTLGDNFAGRRSYFDVWDTDAEDETEPRLSDSFLTDRKDAVIAVSAPIWYEERFQGVAGVFIRLGDLVRDPETSRATGKMLVFDARQGQKNAQLIHNQGQEIENIESVDLRPYLSRENVGKSPVIVGEHPTETGTGEWRIAPRSFMPSSDPEQGLFVVMMVEDAARIEDPGKRLWTNLVTIGWSTVGFAALVLSAIWGIILQRVVKT